MVDDCSWKDDKTVDAVSFFCCGRWAGYEDLHLVSNDNCYHYEDWLAALKMVNKFEKETVNWAADQRVSNYLPEDLIRRIFRTNIDDWKFVKNIALTIYDSEKELNYWPVYQTLRRE